MGDHLEIEQKFEVDDDFERPDFGTLPGVSAADPVTFHLAAVYYDTADMRLAAAKITLRRRTGGTDEGWHLKLPAGSSDERQEIHAPLSASEEVPGALAARVAEVTGGAPLVPIATLDTERTIVTLCVNSAPVAEVADDVVTARRLTGTGRELRWREVEVEVPERSPDLQDAVARLLLAAGARRAGKASKLARLLDS